MWRQLAIVTDDTVAETLSEAMVECGALAVSFEDAADQPLFEPKPGEVPVWDQTRVIGLFPVEADVSGIAHELKSRFGRRLSGWETDAVQDRPWERVWLEYFQPVRYGRRLWICPTGFDIADGDPVVVALDPGLAFGTGTHPTTALCLEWLDAAAALPGARVIDYGCGSGILAIAALVLGARWADAVDIDPQALVATTENARKNDVQDRVRCGPPEQLGTFEADILLANILANPLIELAPDLARRVRIGGQLVLSGVLADQADDVSDAYRTWFEVLNRTDMDGWVRLDGTRLR